MRPSIIVRTQTCAGKSLEDGDEVGIVATAYRAPRIISRQFSSEVLLQPGSSASTNSSDNIHGHSRSSTFGSITSEGFKNMIATNRNSWTGSYIGDENSLVAESEKSYTQESDVLRPIVRRNQNRQIESVLEEDKIPANNSDFGFLTVTPQSSSAYACQSIGHLDSSGTSG